MKKIFSSAFIIICFTFSSFGFGQNIDESVIANLSQQQIEGLINAGGSSKSNPAPVVTESTVKVLQKNSQNDPSKKFGYDYFSSIPTSIVAVGDLPLPNDYKISLKDQFTVILTGSKEDIFDLDVNLDGTVLFPEIGSISVVGETLGQVKKKLSNLIDQSYIGVEIDLSIKNLAAKKITIVGAVNAPGTYLVNPFSTISSSLAYSGGVSEVGTLRKIKLIRVNGDVYYFDLYDLLISGKRVDDITVEAGDVIIIDPAEHFVKLSGGINRQGTYEVLQDETIDDLIFYGLGFINIANKKNINAEILDIDKGVINKIIAKDLDIELSNILSIHINTFKNKNISSIQVIGAVKEPGFYNLDDYNNLKDLIENLNFVDVYPWLGVLEQFDEDNLVNKSIFFNLNDKSTYESINLLPNSRVYFANIDSRSFDVSNLSLSKIREYNLTLNHKGNSYIFPVYGNFSVESFVNLLGLDMVGIDEVATYISPLDNLVLTDNYKNMRFLSTKYHTVSFRSRVNDLISVSIGGAIDYPGTYTLESSATLQDLFELVGEFKSEAFLDGIIFTRQSVRERQLKSIQKSKADLNRSLLIRSQKGQNTGNIELITALSQEIEPSNLGRIAGDFKPMSDSSINTLLLDGDSIIVPKIPNAINVLGEVLNPSAFEFQKGMDVRDAIQYAGGYQDYADKRKIYIIKANGIIQKAGRNIFVSNDNLNPGDTVVVPRKIITTSPGIDALLPITQILSDIAFSAAALDSLSNN